MAITSVGGGGSLISSIRAMEAENFAQSRQQLCPIFFGGRPTLLGGHCKAHMHTQMLLKSRLSVPPVPMPRRGPSR